MIERIFESWIMGRHFEGLLFMNRRSFLTITMGGTAAAALHSSASAAPNRKLRKAIMHSTIGVKGSVLEKYRVMRIHVKDFSAKPAPSGTRTGGHPKLLD